MNINKEILMTIVKNSSNRLEGEQEIIEINEQQLNIVCKKLTELFSLHVVGVRSEQFYCVADKIAAAGDCKSQCESCKEVESKQ